MYNHTLFKQLTSLKSLKLDEDLFTSDWKTFAEMTQLEEIIIHSDEDNTEEFIEELRLFREVNKCKVHYTGYKMFDIDEIDLSSCYSKLKEYSTVKCTQDGIVNVNCNHGAVTLIIKHKPNKSVKYE